MKYGMNVCASFLTTISTRLVAGVLLMVLLVAGVQAQASSAHSLAGGEPFFLLTDTSYGSDEEAKVRVEVTPYSYAVSEYGGVDMLVYRISDPMAFLQKQKNLHRVQTDGKYVGEGLSNTLSYLWDSWYKRSRRMWQSLFNKEARQAVVQTAPELRTPRTQYQVTEFKPQPQYQPLAKENGFELVQRFRYPIMQAQSIKPLDGVKLDGSSSDFVPAQEGNVYVPVGTLSPGLYLVEGVMGQYRANTLLFVSDTVGVTKLSSEQLLLWAANRKDSAPAAGVQVFWTDGVGVLQSGKTAGNGVVVFDRSSPERTYVMGQDTKGGVFISENFYYDSEIYNSKMYAVTDRPLYRPGDAVQVSIWGRHFKNSSDSNALRDGTIDVRVIDPNGVTVLTKKMPYKQREGAHTGFTLPPNSSAGGYELRFSYAEQGASNADVYAAAFRVVEYVKPHFSVHVQLGKKNHQTGEKIEGDLQLRYPDGKPVKNAKVQLSLRAQQLTMVDGEMAYAGMFPVKLQTQELQTDGSGNVAFVLPAAKEPSRYALTAFASDGAALRVRTSKEILIERAASRYSVRAAKQFSQVGESVPVRFVLQESTGIATQTAAQSVPAKLQWVRLEDQSKGEEGLSGNQQSADAGVATLKLPKAGSYSLTLRDADNNILGGTTHWVAGAGLQVVPGSIEIVTDKPSYSIGDTAQVLVSFSEPVADALLTLERDAVEQYALASAAEQGGSKWIELKRVSPTQLQAHIPIKKAFAPNMTFSVAYSKGGQFVFENRGLVVGQPSIELAIESNKAVYAPGETVELTVQTRQNGKPVAAQVALGVVDEMVYVLQPEIAPRIGDFFYHARRNNVRTTSSLAFISYDMATGRLAGPPARSTTPQRGVKVLERPRREEVDTAYWNGALQTDANGVVKVQVRMPDSLTRWRVTARALQADTGLVGQKTAYVRSSKDVYTKWTSPDWMRVGDTPTITWAAFNQTNTAQALQYRTSFDSAPKDITLQPGANTIALNIPKATEDGTPAFAYDKPLRVELLQNGKVVDALEKYVDGLPTAWQFTNSQTIPIAAGSTQVPLSLPKDAHNIQVQLLNSVDGEFARIAQDLLDYPYGCVEQTASRLIPLSMAIPALQRSTANQPVLAKRHSELRQRLQQSRLRLVYMAGPEGTFGWWGNQAHNDVLMTAYAYYADWQAAKVLGMDLPTEHWQPMLELFDPNAQKGKSGKKKTQKAPAQPLTQRVMALWFAQQMGMPTDTILKGLLAEWKNTFGVQAVALSAALSNTQPRADSASAERAGGLGSSAILIDATSPQAKAMALVLLDDMVLRSKGLNHAELKSGQLNKAALATARPPQAKAMTLVLLDDIAGQLNEAALATARHMLNSTSPTLQTLAYMYEKDVTGSSAGADYLQSDVRSALERVSAQEATFEKALTLIFSKEALGNAMLARSSTAENAPVLGAQWLKDGVELGGKVARYRLKNTSGSNASGSNASVPNALVFRQAVPEGWSAVVRYDSVRKTQTLPIAIERKLYRLEASDKAGEYTTSLVQAGDSIDTDGLYLDTLNLQSKGAGDVHYALLEVPLPPGASVEASTWGIKLAGESGQSAQNIERAQNEAMRSGYAVPFAHLTHTQLKAGTTVRHLVRFSQKGTFSTPPARLYSMYQPHRVAVDGKGRQFAIN